MNLAQIVILSSIFLFVLYIISNRSLLTDRILLASLAFLAVFFVLFPDLSTTIANWLGIGRGTDMIFYFFILFTLFRFVGISSEQKRLERSLTEVIRELAILTARQGPVDDPTLEAKVHQSNDSEIQ